MTTTTTRTPHHTTDERILVMAFELSEKSRKLGFTTGPGQKPHEHGVAARSKGRVRQEVVLAKKRFGLPANTPVVSCYQIFSQEMGNGTDTNSDQNDRYRSCGAVGE